MLEIFSVTIAGVFLAQMAPGPNLLAVAGMALGQGRLPALFVSFGVASAIFVWVLLVTFGLAGLLAIYPGLLTAMKFLGGGYLCYICGRAFYAGWSGKAPNIKAIDGQMKPTAAFMRGFLVNMTNPKSALMWSAVATFMYGSGLTASQVLWFAPLGAFTALMIYGTYALVFSTGVIRALYIRFSRWFEFAFGAAFGAIGGSLVLDGLKDLRP